MYLTNPTKHIDHLDPLTSHICTGRKIPGIPNEADRDGFRMGSVWNPYGIDLRHFPGVSRTFPGRFPDISRVFPGHFF